MFQTRIAPWSLLLLALLLGSSVAHAAKLYKWTDEAGNIHYSQSPPDGTDSTEIHQDEAPLPEETTVDTTPLEPPPSENIDTLQHQADRCQLLYDELERYENRLPITDSEGNPVVVSDEMREAKINELKSELDNSCQ